MSGSQGMALTREKKQRLAAARGWPDGHVTCGVRSSFSRRTKPYCHQRKMAADDGNATADDGNATADDNVQDIYRVHKKRETTHIQNNLTLLSLHIEARYKK
ncbi:hypothetical protein HKD37_18G051355 [Glycine soja]